MPTTFKQHDTWPPLRGVAADEEGNVDLTAADSLKLIAKSGATLISGTAVVIDPAEAGFVDDEPVEFNWKYTWHAGDTAITGEYKVELEVTWDSGSSPPEVETFPNSGTEILIIEQDQG